MSPAQRKKSAKTGRKAAKKAGGSRPAKASKAKVSRRPPTPRNAPRRVPAGKTIPPAVRTAASTGHAHCAASDPFGDPCQNLPRRPSKYCVIHSYLER